MLGVSSWAAAVWNGSLCVKTHSAAIRRLTMRLCAQLGRLLPFSFQTAHRAFGCLKMIRVLWIWSRVMTAQVWTLTGSNLSLKCGKEGQG